MAAGGIRVLRFMGHSDVLHNTRVCLYLQLHTLVADQHCVRISPAVKHYVTLRVMPCMQVGDTPPCRWRGLPGYPRGEFLQTREAGAPSLWC